MNNTVGLGIVVLGVVGTILVGLLGKKTSLISIRSIFTHYLKVFKGNKGQFVLFLLVPILISVYLIYVKPIEIAPNSDDVGILNNINVVVSIFVTMLITIFSTLLGENNSNIKKSDAKKEYMLVKKETAYIVFMLILCCVLLMLICFGYLLIGEAFNETLNSIASFCVYFLLSFVLINLFIVLKRIEKLFTAKNALEERESCTNK